MVTKEFKLPDVGEGVAEGELVSWLVEPGDAVTEDQPVAEVETDKALVEVPSPYNGTVKELLAEEGEIVPVGNVLLTFEVEGEEEDGTEGVGAAKAEKAEAVDTDTPEPAGDEESVDAEPAGDEETIDAEPATTSGRVFASPSARRLARELGVDIGAVDGSGPGGRVTEADIRQQMSAGVETGSDESEQATPATAGTNDGKSAVRRRDNGETETETTAGASPSASPTEESAGGEPSVATPAGRETTLATPATRQVARTEGVDIDDVPTEETREGQAFVTAEHVQAYAAATRGETAVEEATAAEAVAGPTADAGAQRADVAEPGAAPQTIPYRGVRRTIGQRMAESKYTAPHVSHHDTVEVSSLVEMRERLKPKAEERGVKLTYMPFLIKAVVAALKENPILNSELREDDEEIVLKDDYHVGIAVATDAGLMVPVVEDADEKGLLDLAATVNDLAARARERKLEPSELRGSTFTITNFGAIGGEYATPIINYPETAILGLGAIEHRPVVESDSGDEEDSHEVVARPTLPLSLTIDHRVIDGAEGATFTNDLMQYLQEPSLLLLE